MEGLAARRGEISRRVLSDGRFAEGRARAWARTDDRRRRGDGGPEQKRSDVPGISWPSRITIEVWV